MTIFFKHVSFKVLTRIDKTLVLQDKGYIITLYSLPRVDPFSKSELAGSPEVEV